MNATTLTVKGLATGYGRMQVVDDVSFQVSSGEVIAILGRNGAGKTTSLLAVAGVRRGPTRGRIDLGGQNVSGNGTRANVRAGLVHVPAGHRVFRGMSVEENLRIGAYPAGVSRQFRERVKSVYELFPILKTYSTRQASYLSGGEQQMLAIGQALMGDPKILMLDEPTAGLSPMVSRQIFKVIEQLRSEGLGIVLVEQDLVRAMDTAVRWYVIEAGVTRLSGGPLDAEARAQAADVVAGLNSVASINHS